MTERTCGNCGEAVGTEDMTCPICGALLAAYEAPIGSMAEDLPNLEPSAVMPEVVSAPPRSPIVDALEGLKGSGSGSGVGANEDVKQRASTAAEVPESRISEPWSPTRKPAEPQSQVSAVTFPPPRVHSAPAAKPISGFDTAMAQFDAERALPRSAPKPNLRPVPANKLVQRDLSVQTERPEGGMRPALDPRVLKAVVVGVVILIVFMLIQGGLGFGGMVATLLVIGLVLFGLYKMADATARRTTQMPWVNQDKTRLERRKRRAQERERRKQGR